MKTSNKAEKVDKADQINQIDKADQIDMSDKVDKANSQSTHPAPHIAQSAKPDNRRWLAAYTRMHHEKKVQERLTAQGIESFLPIHTVVRQWSDRKKKIDRVLISMIVFVHVNPQEQLQVLQTPSVMHYMVLRGERTPAVIPHAQMNSFRFVVERSEEDVNFDVNCLQIGQEVRVVTGPLMGLTGQLVNIKGKSNIAIRIDRVGCATVEISADMVEPVEG